AMAIGEIGRVEKNADRIVARQIAQHTLVGNVGKIERVVIPEPDGPFRPPAARMQLFQSRTADDLAGKAGVDNLVKRAGSHVVLRPKGLSTRPGSGKAGARFSMCWGDKWCCRTGLNCR